jgi:hypothetical protein
MSPCSRNTSPKGSSLKKLGDFDTSILVVPLNKPNMVLKVTKKQKIYYT